jgi:hypothetical protein
MTLGVQGRVQALARRPRDVLKQRSRLQAMRIRGRRPDPPRAAASC